MPIDGYFNANGEPAVQLELDGVTIELLVDTGFAGSLLIPDSLAGGLPLRFEGFEEFYTVTGHVFVAPAYSLQINWLGEQTIIAVAVGPDITEGLLGGQMLNNCRLTVDYYDRAVTITRRV